MGYCSQVSFTITGPRDEVMAKLVAYRMTVPNAEEAIAECRFIDAPPNLVIRFHADNTKWYESYEDVIALTALYDMFEESIDEECTTHKFNTAFVRIGDDDADIETRYVGDDAYDLESVCRTIDSAYEIKNGKKFGELVAPS